MQANEQSGSMARPRPSWLPRDLYPFEDRYIGLDGCHVHYADEVEGPVLLLLHGNSTYSFLYRNIIKGLRDRFRCIAPDYPGFGLSIPRKGYSFRPEEHSKIVQRLVLALDLSGVTVVVHDWGTLRIAPWPARRAGLPPALTVDSSKWIPGRISIDRTVNEMGSEACSSAPGKI